MRVFLLPAIVLALGPFGCPDAPAPSETDAASEQAPEPAKPESGGTDETISPTPEPPKPAPAPAPDDATLTADATQSQVGFAVSRATTGHIGHFESFTATLELVAAKPTRLQISVETGSVVADRKGLTSHLKSADFFDVAKYPTATFTTASIVARAEDEGPQADAYTVEGTMELHGVKGELEFPATIEVGPERIVGKANLAISAKRFGIAYAGMEAELADDEVALEIELVFPRVGG